MNHVPPEYMLNKSKTAFRVRTMDPPLSDDVLTNIVIITHIHIQQNTLFLMDISPRHI